MTDFLSNLTYAKGSRKKKKRIGRGQGSGHGGTATRGHKGQGSRSGSGSKRNFEGGQMPLVRRLPKQGFTNINRVDFTVINVGALQKFLDEKKISGENITPDSLFAAGVISKKKAMVKILGDGELKSKITISAHKFSKSAMEKIATAGGTATEITVVPPPAQTSDKK